MQGRQLTGNTEQGHFRCSGSSLECDLDPGGQPSEAFQNSPGEQIYFQLPCLFPECNACLYLKIELSRGSLRHIQPHMDLIFIRNMLTKLIPSSCFQISFFSTSPELSNKQRFEYFSRTIPSDHYQTMAMAKIVEQLEWKYMSIIYEESNYGIKVKL